MALVGSITAVVKGVVEIPIGIVKSIGREPASRAEEGRREDCVPGLPNQAQEISLSKGFDALPNRLDNCSTSREAAQRSARARNNAHDLTSPILDKKISPFDVQEELGNANMNKNHPSEPQEHPSIVSRSFLSTKSLTLATVQPRSYRGNNLCSPTDVYAQDDARRSQRTSALRRYNSTTGNGCDRMAEWGQDRWRRVRARHV